MTDVSLRLTGAIVRMLDDNGHLPGHRAHAGPFDLSRLDPQDGDYTLNAAGARWNRVAHSRRVGRGWVHTATVSVRDAEVLLDYIESVVGALAASEDPEVRGEARRYARGLASAVRHLRQQGVGVVERRRGVYVDHRLVLP